MTVEEELFQSLDPNKTIEVLTQLQAEKVALRKLMEEARWLLDNSGDASARLGYKDSLDWLKRREKWLGGQP